MEILEEYAERNTDGSPDLEDLVRLSGEPHSVRAIQMRDGNCLLLIPSTDIAR